jgi:hypothetical protein
MTAPITAFGRFLLSLFRRPAPAEPVAVVVLVELVEPAPLTIEQQMAELRSELEAALGKDFLANPASRDVSLPVAAVHPAGRATTGGRQSAVGVTPEVRAHG